MPQGLVKSAAEHLHRSFRSPVEKQIGPEPPGIFDQKQVEAEEPWKVMCGAPPQSFRPPVEKTNGGCVALENELLGQLHASQEHPSSIPRAVQLEVVEPARAAHCSTEQNSLK